MSTMRVSWAACNNRMMMLITWLLLLLLIMAFLYARNQDQWRLSWLQLEALADSRTLPAGGSQLRVINITELIKGPQVLHQDDDFLVSYIKTRLVPPAPSETSLVLSGPIAEGQVGQIPKILEYFQNKKGGFYFEAGAFDGEFLSNTLYLEANMSWTGLLVEPNSAAFKTLQSRNRKSKLINSCLSIHKYPEETEFDAAHAVGGILGLPNPPKVHQMRAEVPAAQRTTERVQCFPMYSLLLAIGNPKIDLLSLDVEGAEEAVLRTLPWDKVDIQSWLIEVEHSNIEAINEIMADAGYEIFHKFGLQDFFYVKIETDRSAKK